jgi:hypothetical protein
MRWKIRERETTKRDTTATQVWGSRKEIRPLLLHYYLYNWIDGGTIMVASKLSVRGGRRTMNCETIK